MPFRERGVPKQLPDLRAVSSSSGSRHLLPLSMVSGEGPEAPKDLRRIPCPRGRPGPQPGPGGRAEVSSAALHTRHYTKAISCDLPEGQPLAVVTARLSLWRVKPSLDKPDSISPRVCSGGRTPVNDDQCLWLALAVGATVERVAPASTGPGPSSTKKEEHYGWEG